MRDIYSEDAPDISVQPDDHIFVEDSSANIVTTSSIVDHKGNVVFDGVGEIKAAGRSLDALRAEIKILMQQVPDLQNAFQSDYKFCLSKSITEHPRKACCLGSDHKYTNDTAEALTQSGLCRRQ